MAAMASMSDRSQVDVGGPAGTADFVRDLLEVFPGAGDQRHGSPASAIFFAAASPMPDDPR